MRKTPRFFPRRLDPDARLVYGVVTAFFVGLFLALIWPVYPAFGTIRPLVLGIPLSLFYVVVLLVAGFLALLLLYLWEGRSRPGGRPRRARSTGPVGGDGPPAGGRGTDAPVGRPRRG